MKPRLAFQVASPHRPVPAFGPFGSGGIFGAVPGLDEVSQVLRRDEECERRSQ
jgi:hypothetical protein